MSREIFGKCISLTIFGIAMGLLEAIVVVYLRELHYPEGFAFPLKPMVLKDLSVEYIREAATIVMLAAVGIVAGKNFPERFSFFLYSFGVWDILYYVWLKVLLDWPSSVFTWDILFLIPVIWAGPVLAPLIVSLTMIAIAGCILFVVRSGRDARIRPAEWTLLFTGALIILISFTLEYTRIIVEGGFLSRLSSLAGDPRFQQVLGSHVPTSFPWYLFALGEALILCFLTLFIMRKGADD